MSKASFIVPPRDIAPGLYDLTISRCRLAGFAPRIVQNARQMQTVIGLVSCGMGIALVYASVRNLKRASVSYQRLRTTALIELGICGCARSRMPSASVCAALQVAAQAVNRLFLTGASEIHDHHS